MFINTPTAIPTKVPLKPYNPFRISSQEYPAIRAVDVLTTVPNRARHIQRITGYPGQHQDSRPSIILKHHLPNPTK